MEICIDFDGTCTTHDFPNIGKEIGAPKVLKRLVENGHKLILFTMRANEVDVHPNGKYYLSDAVKWFADNGISLYGVQSNPTQKEWTTSPKAYGQLYIDDAALGCPLKFDAELSQRPFVDWDKVSSTLEEMGLLPKSNGIKEAYIELFGESIYLQIAKGIDSSGWYSNERNDAWLPLQNQRIMDKLDFKSGNAELRPKSLSTLNSTPNENS